MREIITCTKSLQAGITCTRGRKEASSVYISIKRGSRELFKSIYLVHFRSFYTFIACVKLGITSPANTARLFRVCYSCTMGIRSAHLYLAKKLKYSSSVAGLNDFQQLFIIIDNVKIITID